MSGRHCSHSGGTMRSRGRPQSDSSLGAANNFSPRQSAVVWARSDRASGGGSAMTTTMTTTGWTLCPQPPKQAEEGQFTQVSGGEEGPTSSTHSRCSLLCEQRIDLHQSRSSFRLSRWTFKVRTGGIIKRVINGAKPRSARPRLLPQKVATPCTLGRSTTPTNQPNFCPRWHRTFRGLPNRCDASCQVPPGICS